MVLDNWSIQIYAMLWIGKIPVEEDKDNHCSLILFKRDTIGGTMIIPCGSLVWSKCLVKMLPDCWFEGAFISFTSRHIFEEIWVSWEEKDSWGGDSFFPFFHVTSHCCRNMGVVGGERQLTPRPTDVINSTKILRESHTNQAKTKMVTQKRNLVWKNHSHQMILNRINYAIMMTNEENILFSDRPTDPLSSEFNVKAVNSPFSHFIFISNKKKPIQFSFLAKLSSQHMIIPFGRIRILWKQKYSIKY